MYLGSNHSIMKGSLTEYLHGKEVEIYNYILNYSHVHRCLQSLYTKHSSTDKCLNISSVYVAWIHFKYHACFAVWMGFWRTSELKEQGMRYVKVCAFRNACKLYLVDNFISFKTSEILERACRPVHFARSSIGSWIPVLEPCNVFLFAELNICHSASPKHI